MPTRYAAFLFGALVLALPGLCGGCHRHETQSVDAGPDLGASGDTAFADTNPAILAIDFTVNGCPKPDLLVPRCSGRAPLSLTFIPISPGGINRYLWDFGDATARSSDQTPSHTYSLPGSYDVTLLGAGGSGTVSKARTAFVVVTESPAGQPCDVDTQCQAGLACVCGAADKCQSAFARGLCAAPCPQGACRDGTVCAQLPLSTGQAEAWQQPLCLPSCVRDADCGTGLHCRDLPAKKPDTAWVTACFVNAPSDVGAPCRGANGQLRPDLCITSVCADLGGNGLCTLDCAAGPCPPGTACATMNTGQQLCLRRCGAAFACDEDALLACAAPDDTGPLGFRVPDGPATATYCSPKRCTSQTGCGTLGICTTARDGSQCIRKL